MEVKSREDSGITIITPVGRVDTATVKAFEEGVMAVQNNKIVISFSQIDYISSAGLRVVLMLGKKLSASKGTLVLIDMPTNIFNVFKMSGFDKILKICANFEESKQFFN